MLLLLALLLFADAVSTNQKNEISFIRMNQTLEYDVFMVGTIAIDMNVIMSLLNFIMLILGLEKSFRPVLLYCYYWPSF